MAIKPEDLKKLQEAGKREQECVNEMIASAVAMHGAAAEHYVRSCLATAFNVRGCTNLYEHTISALHGHTEDGELKKELTDSLTAHFKRHSAEIMDAGKAGAYQILVGMNLSPEQMAELGKFTTAAVERMFKYLDSERDALLAAIQREDDDSGND